MESENLDTKKTNSWALPVAIVLAALIVGVSIYFSSKSNATNPLEAEQNITVKPVDSADHVMGNPNAPIKIVEYGDLQCPYCKEFDVTMRQVMQDYQSKGVAWVYRTYWAPRNLPDGSAFHPLGGQAAEAAECVAELAGNDKYFDYIGQIFANQDTDGLTNPDKYAVAEGIDKTTFDNCVSSGKNSSIISQEYADGNTANVSGTPTAFIISKNGIIVVPGAVTYSDISNALDTILKNQ